MLNSNVIPFLTELNINNNREWFTDNKKWYQQSIDEFKTFIDDLIPHIAQTDSSLIGLSAKECVFRIYRDVRFSKDKTPYKIHFGAHIAVGGRKSKGAGFYLHIEPAGTSFVGGGIFMPEPPILKALRNEFYKVPEELIEIIEDADFKKNFKNGLWDKDKLKLAPKGFPKDFEHIDLLKNKSFVAINELSVKEISNNNLILELVKMHKVVYPLNRLINTIIDDANSVRL